ncbi:MAG: alcohol dehydrogenase catalytic domain-containing protein, partial [Burkholderiales bacterium]|nr:alcohol dehydrogenase catalytic domain-containing protein [Burkholderiales bacterium]
MSTRIAQMVIDEIGDRSRLHRTEAELPAPGPGEVRVRHTAIGVNYVDIYHRTGLYALPPLPVALGVEAAGVVEAVGPQVEGWRPGQRVAY